MRKKAEVPQVSYVDWLLANQRLWEGWPRDIKEVLVKTSVGSRREFVVYDRRRDALLEAMFDAGIVPEGVQRRAIPLDDLIEEARAVRKQMLLAGSPANQRPEVKMRCFCCGGPYDMSKPKGEGCSDCWAVISRPCPVCEKCPMHCLGHGGKELNDV